jgi:hypothetical protein
MADGQIRELRVEMTFETGRRHAVAVRLDNGEGLAGAFDDAALACELYLEDHPDGPAPFVEVANG